MGARGKSIAQIFGENLRLQHFMRFKQGGNDDNNDADILERCSSHVIVHGDLAGLSADVDFHHRSTSPNMFYQRKQIILTPGSLSSPHASKENP